MSLPLALRLPNPPAALLGRDAEQARVTHGLGVHGAAVIQGPAGYGKTALALTVARALHAQATPPALFVSLEAAATPDLYGPLLRALAHAGGHPMKDALAGLSEPDEKLARAIDLADATASLVLVDDLHEVGPEAAAHLVRGVLAHARRTRWLFTSRVDLSATGLGVAVDLGPLGAPALGALAALWAPDVAPEERARAARHAEGSPWRLVQVLRGRDGAPALPSALARACEQLAHLSRPVPRAALPLDAATIDALLGRALLTRQNTGVLLHDVARDAHAGALAVESDEVGQLVASLEREPEAALEAIRLRLCREERAAARAILETHGERLLEEGYAPELAALLPVDATPPLTDWALRIAAERGDPAELARAVAPGSDADLATHAAWLEVRYALEDREATPAIAEAVARRALAANEGERACRAQLIAASIAMMMGDREAATQTLARAVPATRVQALHVRAVRAMIAAIGGDRATAESLADALEAEIPSTRGHDRGSLTYNLGIVWYSLKRPLVAARLFEQAFPDDELATAALLGRRALEMDAHLSVLSGNLGRARRLLSRLGRFVTPGTPVEVRTALIRAHVDLLEGRLDEAESEIARAREIAAGYGGVEDLAFAAQLAATLAWRRDREPPALEAGEGVSSNVAAAWHALARVCRFGDAELPSAGASSADRAEVEALHAAAQALLRDGDPGLARALSPPDRPDAAKPTRLFVWAWAAELRIAAGGPFDLARASDLAHEIGAREVAASLALLRAVEDADVAAVLAMARAGVPLALQLVQGGDAGRLRAALLSRLRAELGWSEAEPDPGAGDDAGPLDPRVVFVDARRGRVLAADGVVAFRPGSVPLTLLRVLARHPDGASKETLTLEAWGMDEYHPLRHDNRLRVAVRKLRRRVEPLLDRPLLDTLEDGYALAVPLRWLG